LENIKMATPNVLALTGYGINCDWETHAAFQRAGADSERVHVSDIVNGDKTLYDAQILAFPGGFSYGDDIRSGKVLAEKFKQGARDQLEHFIEDEKLVIGICNGFQVMVNLGILPGFDLYKQEVTLMKNDSNMYEDRWVHLTKPEAEEDKCIFTRGIDRLYVPVAHGEGKFYADDKTIGLIEAAGMVVFRYAWENGDHAEKSYPQNPNGAVNDIAGIRNAQGNVFGMMPHPERHLEFINHPRWTAIKNQLKKAGEPIPEEGPGMQIFRNAVNYFK